MSIKLNEHWCLEEQYENTYERIQKRIYQCTNLIESLHPTIMSKCGVDTTRYREYFLYLKTLTNIKHQFNESNKEDLDLIENRLDILEGRLADMYLVTTETST